MRFSVFLTPLLLLATCYTLAPKEQRIVENIIPTNVSKTEAYERVLLYLAKRMNNANSAIQLKDPASGRIVSNMTLRCTPYFAGMMGGSTDLSLDITVKDNKMRIIFDDLIYFQNTSMGRKMAGPENSVDVTNTFRICLKKINDEIVDAVEGKGTARSNDF